MPNGPLVFDASALFNFGHRGQLAHLLTRLRESFLLFIPPAVVQEVVAEPDFDYAAFIATHFSVRRAKVSEDWLSRLASLSTALGTGELEVLLLSFETNGTAVIDERVGRRAARALGLGIIGTLGLLQFAVSQGWVTDVEGLADIQMLRRKGFRCPPVGDCETVAEYLGQLGPD